MPVFYENKIFPSVSNNSGTMQMRTEKNTTSLLACMYPFFTFPFSKSSFPPEKAEDTLTCAVRFLRSGWLLFPAFDKYRCHFYQLMSVTAVQKAKIIIMPACVAGISNPNVRQFHSPLYSAPRFSKYKKPFAVLYF